MERGLGVGLVLELAIMLAGGAIPVFAQTATTAPPPATTGVPARNGNIYNYTAHEPSAPLVNGAEHSAGIAPSAQQAQRENDELARINKQLQEKEGVQHPNAP